MLATPLPFPKQSPEAYATKLDEPVFDPRLHLALEMPDRAWTLDDIGYSPAETSSCASRLAITAPFRLLSKEGVAAVRRIAIHLRGERRTSTRTAAYLTGGVYRSRFLRDLCNSPDVAGHLSKIAGCELLPHSMPSQQLYINYAPDDVGKAVDTWHTDGIGFDYVVLVSDPATFVGGEFQFFRGTKDEAAALLRTKQEDLTEENANDLPAERVVSFRMPAAGHAILQQGSFVVHRATRLEQRAERITLVPGYVARDAAFPDPTRDVVATWGEPGIVAEYARHKAWLGRTKLDHMIASIDFDRDPQAIVGALRDAIADVEHAMSVISAISEREPAV
ncbi:MAG TPA: hypothetical protein VJ822_03380 [Dongiaceae bacterium]|nr:hypothetical protein [Dongiaceae bacterium]